MISADVYLLPFWISLLVQSLTWSLSDSLPVGEKVAHLSIWDDDDEEDDWIRSWSTRDWGWLFRTTTRDPYIDWFFRSTTRRPIIWNRYTPSPTVKTSGSNGTEPYVWVIVGVVIVMSLLIAFIRYACANDNDGDTYDSRPVLHPPPAVIVPPPERTYQPTAVIPPPQNFQNATTAPLGGGPYDHRAPTVPPAHGAGDKPPGYSEVVMADFVEETKFPEVAPRPLDTPPPKYEDGILQKY